MKAVSIDRQIRGSRSETGNTLICRREEDPAKDLEKEEPVGEGKLGVQSPGRHVKKMLQGVGNNQSCFMLLYQVR